MSFQGFALFFVKNNLTGREAGKENIMTTFNFFSNCINADEARKRYFQLSKIYHSDVDGGDKETMQTINDQYAAFIGKSRAADDAIPGLPGNVLALPAHLPEKPSTSEEEFIELIGVLVKLPGIDVELCGCWVWVSGDTKAVKDQLKEAGCKFAAKKAMWYWAPAESRGKRRRGSKEMSEIRAKYGSRSIKSSDE